MSALVHRPGRVVAHRDRWLVSYADLITLLFALFVVLVASAYKKGVCALPALATAHKKGGPSRPAGALARQTKAPASASSSAIAPADQRDHLYAALEGALALPSNTQNVSLEKRPEGIVISMKEAGYFETGQAMPLPAADALIDRIAQVVGPTGVQVRVEGHTDDKPIFTPRFHSNWELSTARAEAVLQMLLAESAVDPRKLSVAGYGSYRPIADNGTEEGRRSNRRVDLVLLMPQGGA